jgi:hypothetical protein
MATIGGRKMQQATLFIITVNLHVCVCTGWLFLIGDHQYVVIYHWKFVFNFIRLTGNFTYHKV